MAIQIKRRNAPLMIAIRRKMPSMAAIIKNMGEVINSGITLVVWHSLTGYATKNEVQEFNSVTSQHLDARTCSGFFEARVPNKLGHPPIHLNIWMSELVRDFSRHASPTSWGILRYILNIWMPELVRDFSRHASPTSWGILRRGSGGVRKSYLLPNFSLASNTLATTVLTSASSTNGDRI